MDEVGQRLVETAKRCRDEAIASCKPGAKLCVIGNTIRYTHVHNIQSHSEYSHIHVCAIPIFLFTAGSEIAHASDFQVCPYFIGHGIGSHFHCHPEIWHHGKCLGHLETLTGALALVGACVFLYACLPKILNIRVVTVSAS